MENDFQGKAGQKVPEMTPAIVDGISERYIELYEHITGEKFEKRRYGQSPFPYRKERNRISQQIR